jgi:chitodextrinase
MTVAQLLFFVSVAANAMFGATITYVQGNYAVPQSPQATVTVPFTSTQVAGDLNVIVVGWNDSNATVSSVQDTAGNVYVPAVGPTVIGGSASQSIYYARNIAVAAGGANSVTVTFSTAAIYPDIRILEYSGADRSTPVDVTAASSGNSSTSTSGALTTTYASDLLVAANLVATTTSGAGSGFTSRLLTSPDGDIAEDRMLTATGSYTASVQLTSSGFWIMQMVAFRAAGTGTSPPTAPGTPTAAAVSASQINLGWTASASTVGLANYPVQRCQGTGCSNFAQIATVPATLSTYSDTGLSAGTSYSYRVQAADTAGNLSAFSGVANATTQGPPSAPGSLTATAASSVQINLIWSASASSVGIANYSVQRCQGSNCTNFAPVGTTTTASYSDIGLTPTTTYSYRVQAADTSGLQSAFSNTATATTQGASTVTYVQGSYATPQQRQSSVAVTYTGAQAAGDLNVIAIGWNDTTSTVSSVTDSSGNVYQVAAPVMRGQNLSQTMYYARNIAAAAAGANTVTVRFNTRANIVDVRILEYRGLDPSAPFEAANSAAGSGSNADSGAVAASSANTLLVGAGTTLGVFTGAGSGLTVRTITSPDGDIAEDQSLSGVGSFHATAPVTGAWVMQAAAFSTVPAVPDTAPPSAPTGLAASPASSSQINLTWSASMDNVGVAGYQVFRNSVQVGTTASPSYSDTGLTANMTYSYTVTAFDAAGNVSGPSGAISATTLALNTQPPGLPSGLTATAASSSQINLAWTASAAGTYPISGYNIYRNGARVATSGSNSYSDTGLQPATPYSYTVQAYDTQGNTSSQSAGASATTPAATTGTAYPLKVNGRYLVDQNNTPFMIVGDSPQSLIGNLSESEAATYFANRQKDGFNAVWINLLCSSYTYCNGNGTTYDGIAPFTAGGDPTTYDLSTPNPAFFARADDMLNLAARYGLVVFLDPIETGSWLSTLENNGLIRAFNYGVFLGNRYKSFPNIIWMSGNDFQNWTNATDNNLVNQVMAGLAFVDPNHLQTTELNYQVSGSQDDGLLVQYTNLDGAYSYYPTYAEVLAQYNAAAIPVFMEEANYEFENNTGADPSTPEILRRQEYWTMLSGATGQLYGNHYTVTFTGGWQNELDTTGVVQLGYMKSFFGSRPWYNLVPDQNHTFVTAGYGTFSSSSSIGSNDYVTAAITPDGTLGIAYLPTTQTITVNMAAFSGPVTARWFDPSNNTYTSITGVPLSNSGTRQFKPPGKTGDGYTDWVLVFEH